MGKQFCAATVMLISVGLNICVLTKVLIILLCLPEMCER
jgi:hypothetical protein